MLLLPSPRRVPLDDTRVCRVGMAEAEATEVVPGDAARSPIIPGNFRAYLLRDADRFGAGIAAHEECPGRQTVGPRLRGAAPWLERRGARGTALRDEGLFDEPARFVAADLAVEDEGDAGLGVLVDRLQLVLEVAIRGRMRD